MKRKYFLRGMGIGILITAAIFTLVSMLKGPRILSDEDIMAEARRLGMVMADEKETDQKDKEDTKTESKEEIVQEEEAETTGNTTVETLTGDDVIPTKDTTSDEIGEEPRNEEGQTSLDGANLVNFSIVSGQDSKAVGQNLKAAGLVKDAAEFDRYLEKHGYDRRIKTGSYKIRMGSTYESIADQITK